MGFGITRASYYVGDLTGFDVRAWIAYKKVLAGATITSYPDL